MVRGTLSSREFDRGRLGLLVAGLAVVGLVLVFGVSAATAPSRGVVGANESLTIVGVQGGGPGLHEDGSVEVLDEQGGVVTRVTNANSYFDVTRTGNGTILAGFMHDGYTDCGPYASPCTKTGFRILDPNASNPTVYEYSFPVRTKKNSEVHDVERLPSGEYLVTDMDQERVFTVWRNGTVSWEWEASEFYTAPEDPTRVDWLHINDVDTIGPDRFLVSVRNANQLVVVERGEGVVEVVNRDDEAGNDDACTSNFGQQLVGEDPRCGDPEVLDHQHNPQWLAPDAVLVADSDNNRIVELHRNGSDGEWFVAWELRRANGIPLSWPRDADRLANGNTLVTDSANQRVVEVNESGRVVWSARFDGVFPYEADRLPEGETVGGAVYNPDAGNVTRPSESGGIPVLTSTLAIVQTSMPLPFWVTEWHLLAVVLGLVAVVGGLGVWGLERRRGSDRAGGRGGL